MQQQNFMEPRPDPKPLRVDQARLFGVTYLTKDGANRFLYTSDAASHLPVHSVSLDRKWRNLLSLKPNLWPLFWIVLIVIVATASLISAWNAYPDDSWFYFAFEFETVSILVVALVALAICLRYLELNHVLRASVISEEHDLPVEELEEKYRDYETTLNKYYKDVFVPIRATLGAAERIRRAIRRRDSEIRLVEQVKRGELGSFGSRVNYNPANVSVVAIHGDVLMTCVRLLFGLIYAAVLVLGPALVVAAIIYFADWAAGYSWFADSILGKALILPAGLYTMIAVPGGIFGISALILLAVAGIPLGLDHDFSRKRVRIRTVSGKWTTVLGTYSEVLSVEAYNLISSEVRQRRD